MVDEATVAGVSDTAAHREHAGDQRCVEYRAFKIVATAVLGLRIVAGEGAAPFRQIGPRGDETNGAALGAGAIQGALGSSQHSQALEVEQPRLRRAVLEEILGRNRYIVNVQTGGGGAGRGDDAANFDIGRAFGAGYRIE